jgi:hypothetical protein
MPTPLPGGTRIRKLRLEVTLGQCTAHDASNCAQPILARPARRMYRTLAFEGMLFEPIKCRLCPDLTILLVPSKFS